MIRNTKKFIPVMLMPFNLDKSIDYQALRQLIEYYLAAGAEGLFANCLSSEMFDLSKEEMLASVAFIVEQVGGRVPIVATGTFQEPIPAQAAFVKQIYATGIDCVIVISSLMASENDSEETFRDNVRQLLALTENIPLGFYECPIPYKRLIQADFLGELVQAGRVTYHKDTSLQILDVKAKIEAAANHADFGLFDAYMGHAVETLQAGSAGLSCIQGNYFPELIVWLCKHYDNPADASKVIRVQQFLSDNMDVMHYAYPATAKLFLHKMNLSIGTTIRRTDVEEMDQGVMANIDKLKIDYDELSEVLFN